MAKDILGVYRGKSTGRTSAQAHTPDATKYHDASQVHLEGESAAGASMLSKLPGNHGFRALRGVVVPRSTPLGGSCGHNPHGSHVIHVDPGPYDEGIVVDLAKVDKEAMAQAVAQSAEQTNDLEDLAVAAFAAVSEQAPRRAPRVAIPEEERLPPLQMPGTYVVPKARPGGGQVKRACFSERELKDRDETARRQQQAVPAHARERLAQTPSLQAALDEDQKPGAQAAGQPESPPRQVTFEIPGGHQFHVLYHDVVRHGITLVLVYDHDRPFQMVYFPPSLEDSQGEPLGMAVLVHARPRSEEKTVLYRVTAPGVQFKYQGKEFCVLLIDKEKEFVQDKESANEPT